MQKSIASALQTLQSFSRQHRRSLIATAVTMMAGFGITALAVAPLVADDTGLTRRLVTETVVPEGMNQQLLDLAAQNLTLTRSDISRGTDTAAALLARLGVRDPSAAAFLRSDATARLLVGGRGGKMVQARTDAVGNLQELVARYPTERAEEMHTHFTRLSISRIDGRWLTRLESVPLTAQSRLASGTIRTSLFAATDESGLPDAVATQLADIFATDIDFHRELRRGDTFSVVYESLMADGEPVAWNEGAGRVLAAEFVSGGKTSTAVWFTGTDGRSGYYDVNGRSKRRAFLASPLEFSRVTSGFAMRLHPLLQSWRAHLGVDYSAPSGTPVRAVGDGTVDFAGRQNGYGNVVQVRHAGDRSTLYAHLSHIDVKQGQRVEQGQRLGAVGMTGWATGPHLHFEFRVGGHHEDPLILAKSSEIVPVDAGSRQRFAETVRTVQARLDAAESVAGTRARFE